MARTDWAERTDGTSVGSATGGRLTRQCGSPTAVDGSPACTWPEVAGCIGRIRLGTKTAAGTGKAAPGLTPPGPERLHISHEGRIAGGGTFRFCHHRD